MTIDIIDTPVAHRNPVLPPQPLREFWSYFSANHGAVAGLIVIVDFVLACRLR